MRRDTRVRGDAHREAEFRCPKLSGAPPFAAVAERVILPPLFPATAADGLKPH
jgi:hypothetical protein